MLDFLNYKFDLLSIILAGAAVIMLLYQCIFYVLFLMYNVLHKNKEHSTYNIENSKYKGVRVIVITNNNADALRESLLQVLEQDYPLFEVVVVNENSTDDTEFILYVLKENYPNITVINLGKYDNKFESYKFCLAIGIRSAKYPTVLLTDVTCSPKSYDWITKMMAPVNADSKTKIVTGLCLREKNKGLAGALEQYDEGLSYMNLITYTSLGNPYTSCGMNMCYDKSFFINNSGFIPQYSLNCNQEDYFVSHHANKHNTSLVTDKESFVYLPAYSSFAAFFRVKFASSLSKKVLKLKDKILLSLLPVSTFLYYALIVLLLIFSFPWQYIVLSVVIKWISQVIIYKKCMAKLEIKKNWIFVPLFEIFFLFFNFIIRVKVLFYRKREKKIKWKE